MAMSAAERQAAYRRRRVLAGQNGERRINTWVATGAHLALERLVRHYGVTQREMLERLITDADKGIIRGLEPDTSAWDEYMGVAL